MGKRLIEKNNNKESLFNRVIVNNKFIMLAFVFSAVVTIFVYYCFGLFPFGSSTILRMDLYHQYGPLFAELYERLVGLKSFLYSWNSGLGGSFLGNFYNYLSSPLSLIVVFFGHKNIPEAIATLILLKGAFASATFAYFLKRSQGKNDASIAAFGVLYSFCGFFIAYYWNVMWLDAMAIFPLAMLGIELIIKNKKFGLFTFALTLTMLSNYYMSFMLCVFSVLFYIVSYFSKYSFSSYYDGIPTTVDVNGKVKTLLFKKLKYSRFLGSGFTFAFSSVLSVCIAAFALIPIYFILQNCSATSESMPTTFTSYYKIFDFLANHLANVEPTIRSSGTDVLPNVYCGIATLILVPLYLFTKSIGIKEKTAYVGLLGFLYLSFNINFANFVWHAFHFPNDLPYRFSYMYSFVLLIIAYKAFTRLKEFTGKEVLGAGVATLFAIVLIQELGSKNVNDITIVTSLSFVVLYTLLFVLQSKDRFPASAFSLLILFSFVAEACIANTDNYPMNQPKAAYAEDLPDFQKLKSNLDEYDGGFYRMELTALRTRMDPCWYNYNGVSTFSSMAYEKVANLQKQLGMASNFINSYTYNPQTPLYNSMNSLKYIVNNSDTLKMNNTFYRQLMSKGKFTAYSNRYYLPIGFCVDNDVLKWEHTDSNPFKVQSDFFTKSTGVENVYNQLPITGAEYVNIDEIYAGFDTGEFFFTRTTPDSDATVTFIITPKVTQSCYVYVKTDNVETFNVNAPDFALSHSDGGTAVLDLGVRPAGEEIRLELPISTGNAGSINVYAYGLNNERFIEGYNIMKAGQLVVSKFEETRILGTVIAPENCVFYTSIPYDKGWAVTVNGKPVDSKDIVAVGEAMLGIKLDKGSNTIELNYMPTGLMLGTYISMGTILLLIFLFILKKIFKASKKKTLPKYFYNENEVELTSIKPGSYSYANFNSFSHDEPELPVLPEQEALPLIQTEAPKQETWPPINEPSPAIQPEGTPRPFIPPSFQSWSPSPAPIKANSPENTPQPNIQSSINAQPTDEPEIVVEKYDED